MTNFAVRPASHSDVALVQSIARRTIDYCYRSFLGDDLVDAFIESGECDTEISQHLPALHLLVDNGHILGFSIVLNDLIHLMMVDHAHHREGHGGRLLRHAEATTFTTFSKGRLNTFQGNDQAIQFYTKHGWKEASREILDQPPLSRVWFEKHAA